MAAEKNCVEGLGSRLYLVSSSTPLLQRHPSLASLRTRSRRATQTPSQVSSKWWDSDAGFVSMTQSLESLNVVGCDQPDSGEGDLGFQIRKRDSQLCVPRARRDYQEAGDFGSCDMEETALVKETTASYPSMHSLRYRHLLESPVHEANQWQEYHTRTGQLTGYLQYKQRQTPRPSASERSIPWKPAFSANSPQSHHSNYPSLGESSSIHLKGSTSYSPPLKAVRESRQTIASKKARDSCLMKDTQGEATSLRTVRSSQLNSSTENEDGTVLLQKTVANNGDDTNSKSTVGGQGGQKAELHNISLATAAEETDVSLQPRLAGHGEQSITGPDHDGEKTTVDLPLPARAATEGPSLHSHAPRGKNILEGIAELSLQSQVANKRYSLQLLSESHVSNPTQYQTVHKHFFCYRSHEARKRLEYR